MIVLTAASFLTLFLHVLQCGASSADDPLDDLAVQANLASKLATSGEKLPWFVNLEKEMQLDTPPRLGGEATKFCNGFCRKAVNFITCEAGCKGVNRAACETSGFIACEVGCLGIKKCRRACRRAIYDPCVRNLVESCHKKCSRKVVDPCTRGCTRKAHTGCVDVTSKIFQTKVPKGAYCAALAGAATAASAPLGPAAPVVGGIMAAGCGVALAQISDKDYSACMSRAKGRVCGEQMCTAMGL